MRIFVLIPVLNHIETTLECLRLLAAQSWRNFETIVIDDGSTDGTSGAINNKYPKVTVLHGTGDLWWAGAINMGLEYVLPVADDDDYVLTLNNDVTFGEKYLEELANASVQKPSSLIGSVCFNQANHSQLIDSGIYFDWRTRGLTRGKYEAGMVFNNHVNFLSGRGTLIPVKVFKQVGVYNSKRLPQYASDNELSLRAIRGGFKACVCYAACLYCDTTITGLKFTPLMKLSFRQALGLLFSKKSTCRIQTRFNFVTLGCPREYLFHNYLAEIFSIFLIITSIPPMWCLKSFIRNGYLMCSGKKAINGRLK